MRQGLRTEVPGSLRFVWDGGCSLFSLWGRSKGAGEIAEGYTVVVRAASWIVFAWLEPGIL